MRIIAGDWRGRRIHAPLTDSTRPTSDRTRETIFNIIHHRLRLAHQTFQDHSVLDVFAGTGAMGLEALSRGASYATFIERESAALKTLHLSIRDFKTESKTQVIGCDIAHLRSSHQKFSLIFIDPPYDKNLILSTLKILQKGCWFQDQALILCETGPYERFDFPGAYQILEDRQFKHCRIFLLQYTEF